MFPVTSTHDSYKLFVTAQLQKHYTGDTLQLLSADWVLIEKIWLTDLSSTADFLKDQYGTRGPKPTDPACMLRSFPLMLLTRRGYSVTAWVDELRRVPLYAIWSGFEPRNTPGIGTFYDFFRLWWDSDSLHIKSREKIRRQKPKKGESKREKASTTSTGKLNQWVLRLHREGKESMSLPRNLLIVSSLFSRRSFCRSRWIGDCWDCGLTNASPSRFLISFLTFIVNSQ